MSEWASMCHPWREVFHGVEGNRNHALLVMGSVVSYLYTEVDVAQRRHGLDLVQPVQVALELAGLITHDIRLTVSGRF